MAARAGEMDELITLQTVETSPDGFGGQVTIWETLAQTWARVQPVRAEESDTRGAVRPVRVYLFEVYRRVDLSEAMRVQWNGEDFNIREIRIGPAREMTMTIVAESGVAQ